MRATDTAVGDSGAAAMIAAAGRSPSRSPARYELSGSSTNTSTCRSRSTSLALISERTGAAEHALDGVDHLVAHRLLETEPSGGDHVALVGLVQRLLGAGVAALEQADDELAVDRGADVGRPTTHVLLVQTRDRVGDLE